VVACLDVFRCCDGVVVDLFLSSSLEREGSVEENLRYGEEAADGDKEKRKIGEETTL
jgi:hypothetical protein